MSIKVTVTIENQSESKFEALAKQYEIAKEIAATTETMKQPVINAVGEEKLKAVYKQLETIKGYLKYISDNSGYDVRGASAYRQRYIGCDSVSVKYYPTIDKLEFCINGSSKPRTQWFDANGIITNWNKYGIYEQLEKSCEKQLEELIRQQEEKAMKISINYNNMLND